MMKKALRYASPLVLAGAMVCGQAYAADMAAPAASQNQMAHASADRDAAADAVDTLTDAGKVLAKMQADPNMQGFLSRAHGLFIVPHYARGGLVAGGSGGEGVMVMRGTKGWSNPLFYNVGGISVGAQAGFEAGAVAFLLMNDKSTASFAQQNNFSLDADAGLTIVDYSAAGQASAGKGDVVVWSDTKGAFAGAMVGVSDINWDDDENAAYYGSKVTAAAVIKGEVRSAANNPLATQLTR
ncbi:MAG: hypothetical protein GC201_13030 [Alphaproteobacteria bacterium]|nr:hypothetical protein [Alphaproteobacteria bacterium]